MRDGNLRRWLRRELKFEFVEQQLQFRLGLGGAGHYQLATVSGRQVHVNHLHGGELLQGAACSESWGQRAQSFGQSDVQAISQKRNQDVCLNAFFTLMKDWPDRQIALEIL